ncbi:hypothetical protein ACWD3I_46880 [Streptomyces sp. NPDC002817]|uniref:hypothetical protein n=1 Tax=Streptomyces sp. NPDC088357 TaxID=3154655 RepID=UPI003439F77C
MFTSSATTVTGSNRPRLITVDAATGRESKPVTLAGAVTSVVPTDAGIVAAHGNRLVRINGTTVKTLASTTTVPFEITADADGGITFIDRELDKKASMTPPSWAKHLDRAEVVKGRKAEPVTVVSGMLEAWDLTRSARGEVFVTGAATSRMRSAPE